MNRIGFVAIGLGFTAVVGAGGFLLGQHAAEGHLSVPAAIADASAAITRPSAATDHEGLDTAAAVASQMAAEREILYYQHPDGTAVFSQGPAKDEQGRDYVAVYADPEPVAAAAPVGPKAAGQGRILYYRNPMGLPDTSPVPKKDPMGMDYVAVHEGDDDGGKTLKINLAKVQKLGVRTEEAALRTLTRPIRAVGTVEVDERRLTIVTTKFEGFIETLRVNQTGQLVKAGEPLMEIYSPDLLLAQQEYAVALKAVRSLQNAAPEARESASSLAEGALSRLRNWDIGKAQIARLRDGGEPTRTLTLHAPSGGVVLDKRAVQGMRFMPGEMLYQIADLSTVWVIAEVFEQDLGQVRLGQKADVTFSALPGTVTTGKVTFIYPTLNAQTRTAKVRIEVPNPAGTLRPALYGAVQLAAPLTGAAVVTVPDSALLDSGTRQVVLVELGEGHYEPRPVKVGARADGLVEILEGVAAGERVVVRANFLIDAESNLKAALEGFQSR
ncbi:MAG: efflux RND transporter periplasmic adaptor subunit [Rhodospirillales bacterium]|nr:efflux RND transporter periplasmic adaptor subunit [Rhodospirillales bacterium]